MRRKCYGLCRVHIRRAPNVPSATEKRAAHIRRPQKRATHLFASASHLHAQHAEAAVGVVEGDTFDQAAELLTRRRRAISSRLSSTISHDCTMGLSEGGR